MPSDQERWKVAPESRRIAHPQKIYLKFPSSDNYVEEYLVDLSMTGMFVRCLSPPPPGTVFDFRMRLVSGGSTIEGTAAVVWVRTEQQRLSHPKGMGARFLSLGEEGQRQIRETVERYARGPDGSQEILILRSVVEETLGEVLGPEAGGGSNGGQETRWPDPPAVVPLEELPKPVEGYPSASKARSAPVPGSHGYELHRPLTGPWANVPWLPLSIGLSAFALVGASVIFRDHLWQPGDLESPPGVESPATGPPLGATPAQGPATPSTPAVPGREDPSAARGLWEPRLEVFRDRVLGWASAWSRQDAEAYLDYYARDFSPSQGLSGPQWRRQRRERLARPGFVEVEIRELQVHRLDSARMRTKFVQSYRSDTLEETSLKVLDWELEEGSWRIVSERVDG